MRISLLPLLIKYELSEVSTGDVKYASASARCTREGVVFVSSSSTGISPVPSLRTLISKLPSILR